MEKQKSKLGVIILIVVLLLTTIGFGGYFVYDKFIKDEPVIEDNNKEETNKEQNNTNVVKDYLNVQKKNKYIGTCMPNVNDVEIDVKLPMLDIDTTNARKLNKMIQDDFKDMIDEAGKSETQKAEVTSYYNYLIRDDIVYLYVDGTNHIGCGSGKTYQTNYFYDIKNDKILSMEEAYYNAGYTIDDLRKTIAKNWQYEYDANGNIVDPSPWEKMTFKDCEEYYCGCGLKIIKENLVPYFVGGCV